MFRRFSAILSPLVFLSACFPAAPQIEGVAAAPPAPNVPWVRPSRGLERPPADTSHLTVPKRLLSLGDVVDIALRNSPVTRLSWAQARASADAYGSAQGRDFPAFDLNVGVGRQRALAVPGRSAADRNQYGPSLSLSYLVLDFGGRAGAIDVARQTAVAADLSHNATIGNTILQVEAAAFDYMANRALRDAQLATMNEATASVEAANERHRVGLATIADVLQARTARSQAELTLESLEGALHISEGNVAVAMGLPANAHVELPETLTPTPDSVCFVTASVDTLIETAVRNRPELAAARAEAAGAAAQVRVARSARLPFLAFTTTGGASGSNVPGFSGQTYSVNFGIQIPIFNGFSREYDIRTAGEQLQAAAARAEITRQQIIQQVFTAYYGLRTATDRVRTSVDLVASATQSESVASGRYREGVGSIVDLLIAQSALANARAQGVDARWQWRTALAQLAHDVGVLGLHGEAFLPAPGGTGRFDQ